MNHTTRALIIISFFLQLILNKSFAQLIPSSRTVNWSLAGLRAAFPTSPNLIDVTTFGAQGNGTTSNNAAVQTAISSASGNPAVIYFPGGTYFFNASLSIPSNIIIRGDSVSTTTLQFNLSGTTSDLFKINGSQSSLEVPLIQNALKDAEYIILLNANNFSAGMYIKLVQDDDTLITSSWASNSVAQIIKISAINNDTLFLESPLRKNFLTSDNSRVKQLSPKKMVGFECFKIERLDSTSGQSSNFNFDNAVNCWIKGIESNRTNYSHVAISNSSNILISGNYFHHSFGYGGSGRAYGVVLQFSSGEVLVENNIFRNLRHSMILQAGANGNVFGYNYSLMPYWNEGSFPTNSAGEIVLHGNYVYANLFEGNICQNIVIDNSHGINGPYNTFLRNRANGYGLVMNSNPSSNTQNFIGNEITNTSPFMGNYVIAGTDHFQYGNVIKGTLTPAGTNAQLPDSYYLNSEPAFFGGTSLPVIGPPHPYNTGTIPAVVNYNSGNYTRCNEMTSGLAGNKTEFNSLDIYPNPASGKFTINYKNNESANLEIIDITGKQVHSQTIQRGLTQVITNGLSEGLYFVKLKSSKATIATTLVIIKE